MRKFPSPCRAALLALLCAAPFAYADDLQEMMDDNVSQQQRIQEGLESGDLSTREAAKLQQEQAELHRLQAKAMRDGKLSNAEQNRLNTLQERLSRHIHRQKNDAQTGNPNSASSQRMQRNTERNLDQQQQIQSGIDSGRLTGKEAADAQRDAARLEKREYKAGRDGKVGAREQRKVRRTDQRQDQRLEQDLQDGDLRPSY